MLEIFWGPDMKNLTMLVWLSQLGLSVAVPLGGFILLAVWLRDAFSLGGWVIWAGIVLGVVTAVDGLRASLRTLDRLSEDKKDEPSPIAFNDHD